MSMDPGHRVVIAPSLLAADFGCLRDELASIFIADGAIIAHFVP